VTKDTGDKPSHPHQVRAGTPPRTAAECPLDLRISHKKVYFGSKSLTVVAVSIIFSAFHVNAA
jgi:hypothetical protein